MNCKPGDLARIVNHPAARMQGVVDRLLVVETCRDEMWTYQGPRMICGCGCGGILETVHDKLLRPIRDPGDDVTSQETRKLPADAGIQHLRETVRAFRAMRDAGVCP